jgi:hypothetical protein
MYPVKVDICQCVTCHYDFEAESLEADVDECSWVSDNLYENDMYPILHSFGISYLIKAEISAGLRVSNIGQQVMV